MGRLPGYPFARYISSLLRTSGLSCDIQGKYVKRIYLCHLYFHILLNGQLSNQAGYDRPHFLAHNHCCRFFHLNHTQEHIIWSKRHCILWKEICIFQWREKIYINCSGQPKVRKSKYFMSSGTAVPGRCWYCSPHVRNEPKIALFSLPFGLWFMKGHMEVYGCMSQWFIRWVWWFLNFITGEPRFSLYQLVGL